MVHIFNSDLEGKQSEMNWRFKGWKVTKVHLDENKRETFNN